MKTRYAICLLSARSISFVGCSGVVKFSDIKWYTRQHAAHEYARTYNEDRFHDCEARVVLEDEARELLSRIYGKDGMKLLDEIVPNKQYELSLKPFEGRWEAVVQHSKDGIVKRGVAKTPSQAVARAELNLDPAARLDAHKPTITLELDSKASQSERAHRSILAACEALRVYGKHEQADACRERAFDCRERAYRTGQAYERVLPILKEYVEVAE